MAQTTAIVVGTGGMARHHLRSMLKIRQTKVVGLVEVSDQQIEATRRIYDEQGRRCPPFYATIKELVRQQGPADAAFINTPHKFHLENALDCLKAGMDVLLEKPMVLNEKEAKTLIKARDRTGRLLVVAFPGSLSPAIRRAKELLAAGRIGKVTSIAAYVHQHWRVATIGTWRQDPEISGGGFLFDTGSHMINTVVDLAGQDVVEVMAIMDQCGAPVEINSSVSGRFSDGSLFSLAGAGDSIQCTSRVTVCGTEGVIETGIWGERLLLKNQQQPEYETVKHPASRGVWEQFLRVRAGTQENPCPPEIGLRFARLMDMIRASAASGQRVVNRRR
ncbi:MAG: Gfo/Idh/MocA family oxidoreductase [Candidatus Latescibacterota bacterium]|jgi:predicted dehydrogenase